MVIMNFWRTQAKIRADANDDVICFLMVEKIYMARSRSIIWSLSMETKFKSMIGTEIR